MKAIVKVKKEIDLKTLHVKAGARYWEDSKVNGVEDTEGDLIPCREGDYWCPIIELETGRILNWTEGVSADIHYKVCDDGFYELRDADGVTQIEKDGYVPDIMCPTEEGFGDYIIMKINEEGQILNWPKKPSIKGLFTGGGLSHNY